MEDLAVRINVRRDFHSNRLQAGFTLIEVLIVIAILLAIGGLVVVNLMPRKEQADIDLQKVDLKAIDGALAHFKLNMKRWPSTDEGLAALSSKEAIADENEASNWKGPYLETPLQKDRWGTELTYKFPGDIRGEAYYDLVSAGPDREVGTADDITNHDGVTGTEGGTADSGETFIPPEAPKTGG
jgi:general secretion pathway protein G